MKDQNCICKKPSVAGTSKKYLYCSHLCSYLVKCQ